jgi:hypothetical protein
MEVVNWKPWRITARVPSGTPTGQYRLVVFNNAWNVASNGVTVTVR